MTVRFEVKGLKEVEALLDELKRAALSPRNAYDLVGQRMVAQQKRHFIKQEGPTGKEWEPLAPETIARRLGGKAASTPRGRLGVAGVGRGIRILRDIGTMAGSIVYNVDESGVEAGVPTTIPYAPTHQFGDPERNIPARPFIYINQKEAEALLKLFTREVLKVLPGA